MRDQTIDEHPLRLVELDPSLLDAHPFHPIDLREAAAADDDHVGEKGARVQIGRDRVADHHLAGFEGRLPQLDPRLGRRRPSGFLLELTGGGLEIALVGLDDPLDDRPPAVVPAGEERPTRVSDQKPQFAVEAVGEKTRGSQRAQHYAGPVTVIQATDRLADGLVLSPPTFRLHPGEPLGVGLKRLGVETLDEAISVFYDGEVTFRDAVHTARKATKKVRSLLRLVRNEVGDKVYRFENASMRDAARFLSETRTSAVLVHGVEDIRDLYAPLLAPGTFDEVLERFTVSRDRIEQRLMEDPDVIPRVVANLERARSRYESLPTDPEARSLYGIGIRNDYRAVGPGLRSTHARGRREMVAACQTPTPEAFHRWRKRAKYLRHQMEILTPIWPEVMIGMAVTLDRISELLGQDHDLAELLGTLANRPDLCPNPLERSLIGALAEQRRSDLQTAARILGRRIYAESPGSLAGRLGAYWESMEQARATSLTSLPG